MGPLCCTWWLLPEKPLGTESEWLPSHGGVRAWNGRVGSLPSCAGGQSAVLARVSVGLWSIKPLQNTSMCAFPLPACQSFFINPLAGVSAAVPTSVLSCLPTASMSSHKIKSNYEQIPAPCSPHRHHSSTSGFHNHSQGCLELQLQHRPFSSAQH